jgi:tight adherence protein B
MGGLGAWIVAVVALFLAGAWLALWSPRQSVVSSQSTGKTLSNLEAQMERAGWATLSPKATLGAWLGLSVLVGAVVWVVWPIAVLAPLASVATLFMGRAILHSALSARERRLRSMWPGVVDHIRQAVRSGAGVAESLRLTAERVPEELQAHFGTFTADLERGFLLDQALTNLKANLANPIADRIIEALRMAHEVGGRELPTVLESLQSSVRADISVREEALAKQSWIRAASKLGVSAPWLVLLVISGRPETLTAYSSAAGSALLLAGAAASVLAYRMMARLGRLPEDERWFAR